MSRYMNDAVLRRLRQESIDADSDKPSRVETLARDISNRQRQQSDGIKRRETNTNLAGTRAGESRTGALAAYLAEDGQRAARGRGSLPGTSQAPASSYLTGGGQSASQTSYGARAGGSRTEALAAGLAQKGGPPTVPERLGAAAKSIGYSLAGSVPMLGSLAKQYNANHRADLANPDYQALAKEQQTIENQLDAMQVGYGDASWGTEAELRARYAANMARMDEISSKETVKSGLGLELMRKSGEQQERALEGTTGIPRFLGSNAISIANNAPAMLTGPFAPLVMSIQAAAQRGYELNERGLSPDEALGRGLAAGGIEALTEKYSVENFWKIAEGTGAKTAIKNLWRQAGVEASEESASYALNYLADKAARDPEATFSLSELAESAAGGALSGGFYGGVGLAVNRLGQARTETQSDAVRQEAAQALPTRSQAQGDTVGAAARGTRENGAQAQQQGVNAPSLQTSYADSLGEHGRQNLSWLQERTGRNDQDFLADHKNGYELGRNGTSEEQFRRMGLAGTLSRDDLYSAFSAGHNDGLAEASEAVRRLSGGETVSDAALDRALVFPETRREIERRVGTLPGVNSQDKAAIRSWAERQRQAGELDGIRDAKPGLFETEVSRSMKAEDRDFLNTLFEAVGLRGAVVSQTSDTENAHIENGVVTVYANADDAASAYQGTVRHEVTHQIKALGAEHYQAFEDFAVEARAARDGVSVEALIESTREAYRGAVGQELTEAQAREELAGDFAMLLDVDTDTVRRFVDQNAQNRKTAKGILQTIRDIIARIRERFANRKLSQGQRGLLRQMQEGERLWSEALGEASRIAKENAAQTDGGARFSIKQDEQGRKYVHVDTDILEGVEERDIPRILADIVQNKFHNLITANGQQIGINSRTLREWQRSKEAQRLYNTDKDLYNDKIRTFANADEVLTASKNYIGEQAKHRNYSEFARGDIDFKVGESGYSADVIVGITKSGRAYLYDLVNIKRKNIADTSYDRRGETQARSNVSADTSITDSEAKVNENLPKRFSLKKPVEETRNLIAVHNLTGAKLQEALKLGGLPMPSIAVIKAADGHTNYGDISIVFGKASIDPQANKANHIYGGDAWTPTAPQVHYEADPKAETRITERLNRLAAEVDPVFRDQLRRVHYDFDDLLNRQGGEDGVVRHVLDNYGLKAAFLEEQGQHIEAVTTQKEASKGYNPERAEKYQAVADVLGVTDAEEIVRLPLKELRAQHGAELEQAFPGMTKTAFRMSSILNQVQAYLTSRDASPVYETVTDTAATQQAVDAALDRPAYERWVRGLFAGLEGRRGIYNGKETLTPSGRRRSFDQLHYAYTLENLVKAMGQEQARGVGTWGVSAKALQSVTAPEYRSIRAVKDDSGRLGMADPAYYESVLNEMDSVLDSVIGKIQQDNPGGFSADGIAEVIMEAARGKKTVDAIVKAFRKEGLKLNNAEAMRLQGLFKASAELPTGYFEAKPQRAVGLDEALAVVVPDDLDAGLLRQLEEAGAPVVPYASGDESARLAALNSVEDAKFSLKNSQETVSKLAKQAEVIDYLRGQMKRTKGLKADPKQVKALAGELLTEYSSGYDKVELSSALQTLYDGYANRTDAGAFTEMQTKARELARGVLEESSVLDDETARDYSQLREYLRKTPLTLSDADKGDVPGGFGDFRKAHMGRLRLTNDGLAVDSAYVELNADFGEALFPSDITHPADQLAQIADVLDALEPVYENPFSRNMEEAASGLANDMIGRLFKVQQAKPTFADRQAAKLEKLELQKDWLRAKDLHEQKKQSDAKIEKLMEENRQRVKKAVEKEREMRDKKLSDLKEKHKEQDANRRDKTSRAELRRRIERHAGKLSKKLLNPTDTQHVPEELRGAVAALLDQINLETAVQVDPVTGKRSRYQRDPETGKYKTRTVFDAETGKAHTEYVPLENGDPTKRTEAFRKLREEYEKIMKESVEMVIDPDLTENIKSAEKYSAKRLEDMSLGELQTVWDVLRAAEASISRAGKLLRAGRFKTIQGIGAAFEKEGKRREKDRIRFSGVLDTIDSSLNIDMMKPWAYFYTLGEGGEAVYDSFREAQDQKVCDLKVIQDFSQKLRGDTNIDEWTGRGAKTTIFETSGGKIEMTPAQVMSLYKLMQRPQAVEHVLKGGIRPTAISKGIIERTAGAPVKVTLEDVAKIVSTLTDEQRRIADGFGEFMSGTLSDWGNEISMALYGYKKFREENYFPIQSDKNYVKAELGQDGFDTRVKQKGWTKATVKGANNAVMIDDIFDVFAKHADEMSTYHSSLPALEDASRVFNFKYIDANGKPNGSVKDTIDSILGKHGQDYYRKLFNDLNGGIRSEGSSWLFGNFKAAAVGGNMRVVMQQPTAYARAYAEMDLKYLLGGLLHRGNFQEMIEHSPIAQWKAWGYNQTDLGRPIKDIFIDQRNLLRKFTDTMMKPAEIMDNLTWTRLWNACKLEIQDTTTLEKGSDAYWKAVAKRFDKVIDRTQVVDSVLQRSQMMRSTNGLTRMSTSFMAEPTTSYNLLHVAGVDAIQRKPNAGKKFARVTMAVLLGSAATALAAALADAARGAGDDDDDKNFWERYKEAAAGNFMDQINPAGLHPVLKDVLSLLQGYDVKRTDMTLIADVIQASRTLLRAQSGEGKVTQEAAMAELLLKCSKVFGLPVANIKRDVAAIMNTTLEGLQAAGGNTYGVRFRWDMFKTAQNESTAAWWMNQAFAARDSGDSETAERIFQMLHDKELKTREEIRDYEKNVWNKDKNELVKLAFEAQADGDDEGFQMYTDALRGMGLGDEEIKEALGGKADEARRDEFDFRDYRSDIRVRIQDEAYDSPGYEMLDKEHRESFESAVKTYSSSVTKDAKIEDFDIDSKWVIACRDAQKECGLSESKFIVAYAATRGIKSLKDKDGKPIDDSPGLLKMQAINKIPGLNDKQKRYMYEACGVGKKVIGFNPGRVEQELKKMEKQAAK